MALNAKSILNKAPKEKFPSAIKPMLATLVDKPFAEQGWLYEVKWDGYRALGYCHKGKIELKSRNDKTFNDKFYPVTDALKKWKGNAIVDPRSGCHWTSGATVSAPNSFRPKPGATVSMPLHWDEIKKGLKIIDFNIHNALKRIKKEGDLFRPVLSKGVNLEKIAAMSE